MTTTKLTPINDGVLLKPIEEGETRSGNIVIPDLGHSNAYICTVVATGPGRLSDFGHFIPVTVSTGDIVLIPKIGATRTEFDGDDYYLIPSREILCVIEKIEE